DLNPAKVMRWTLAGLGGAVSYWHIDSDGFGTFVNIVCGSKWWCIGKSEKGFLESDAFLKMDAERADGGQGWDVEGILLTPGTTLIMPPNTPHAVFTVENSICKGGFFYSYRSMDRTFAGMVNSTFINSSVTNTDHPVSRTLIRRMVHHLYNLTI
ncbi:hypothetical protein FA15DRAFT_568602, partial [Coprinopsis marcescibilis]